ncbi:MULTISPECIES: hypothetical protein [unclassified Bacillus cereus group]|uniref:hypothetical protein n=1 Tax=unclassified Bacillus cereus group TaxID=2750818 RepID=UPI000C33B07E|nr:MULTISPECIES: hypothetical protein [unclassified Bacillus cereus group]MDA1588999.1 hypothetical protein [Bacillus cereus group sp. TH225LC]PKF96661.1 hypothetical protein CW365_27550 [Bacillus cereus]
METNKSGYIAMNGFLEELNAYIKANKEVRQTIEDVNRTYKEVGDLSRQMNEAISEATKELTSQLSDIDWVGIMKTWKESAEKLGGKGWTLPLSMTPGEVVEFSEIKDIDIAMEEYFSHDNGYAYTRMKREVLDHKFVESWKSLLEQCFNSYESENYLVVIPNLFIVVEGIARMLISKKFEKYKTKQRTSLRGQYEKVREDVSTDRVYLVVYVSIVGFLNQVFQQGNFDRNPTRFPIINRDWVLHGKDAPSNWKKVDALRLFNAIYSFTAVDFLLEKPKEQLTEA